MIICITLLTSSVPIFSQQTNPVHNWTKENYLQKSKHQKTAAWILLTSGTALGVTGTAIGFNSRYNELASSLFTGKHDKTYVAGEILFFTGIAGVLGSIPLIIASSRNKRRAMETAIFLKMETRPTIQRNIMSALPYPAISLKISLP